MHPTKRSDPHSNTDTTPPPWFDRAIRDGVAQLYALSLDGMPAADTVGATVRIWIGDLWAARRWVDSEAGLIAEAFRRLRCHAHRWPQMADFLEAFRASIPRSADAPLPAVLNGESLDRSRMALEKAARKLAASKLVH